jgi:hypothetical protein
MQPSIEAAARHIIEKATLADLLETKHFGEKIQLLRQANGYEPFTDQQLAFNMRKYLEVKLEKK